MRFRTLAAFCLGTSALTAGGAHAASTDWSNGTGSWFTPGNWTNGVPGASDNATIGNGGTAQIGSGTAAANSLSITNGSAVTLLSGGVLNATTVNLNGTLSAASTTTTASNI